MTEGQASTLCAGVVMGELIALGVGEVVLAPGSRSAPLAYAAFEADRRGDLRLHVRIDERSAGFLALGLAKASQAPVAVITTSGTAVANLYPAVLEAHHSGIPLIVISADRPTSVINTGANQTADQGRLFARHIRADAQLDAASESVAGWQFQLARVVAAATGVRSALPGPVQLNIAFTEPLTPAPVELPPRRELQIAARAATADPTRLELGPRTVIVAGDATPQTGAAARALAATARIPLLAEPSSNARGAAEAITTYRMLLNTPLADEIERVIVFGHPTLSRPVLRLQQRADLELIMVADRADWIDPGLNAGTIVNGVELAADHSDWLQRWQSVDDQLRADLDQPLADNASLTGRDVASLVWSALNDQDVLVVGASNPIRDLDLAPRSESAPTVYANRGLAGIDGTVSTAIGIALATGRPTYALLGDLTFLHDSNGLIIGPGEPRPALRIIVANDNGGSIFATLEQGDPAFAESFERLFTTPHGVDLERLATACHAEYECAKTKSELAAVLAQPSTGLQLVEARL